MLIRVLVDSLAARGVRTARIVQTATAQTEIVQTEIVQTEIAQTETVATKVRSYNDLTPPKN